MTEVQLCQCKSECSGIISRIESESHSIARLQELGLRAGQWIKIVRAGNPTIFEIADSRYCIRPHQLRGISIHVIRNGSVMREPQQADFLEPVQTRP